ncbi:hypothetical protein CCMA1212_004828 [Trichoderma ghanense]|uniref:Uncharacterized protein n=1 Tax=Trichoderma ghanense TaxID=65468 RepID=A0ABY2H619_9HYPO
MYKDSFYEMKRRRTGQSMFDRRFNEITANNQLHRPANSGTTVALGSPLSQSPFGIFRIALERKDVARMSGSSAAAQNLPSVPESTT